MIDLKGLAGKKYRIALDETATIDGSREERPWYYQICGKFGHIWVAGEETLAVYCDRPQVIKRLLAVPGVAIRQRGDREINASFPTDRLDEICGIIRARKRRQVSEADRERLTAILAGIRPVRDGGKSGQDELLVAG